MGSVKVTEEEIIAFVVTNAVSKISEDEIKRWCKDRLAQFKVPAKVFFTGSLPKSATFRTNRQQLRKDALERMKAF